MNSLEQYGIKNAKIFYQLPYKELIQHSLDKGLGKMTSFGSLAINTGTFTGRSPKDRFIVKDAITQDKVWWGDINIPFDPDAFDALYNKVTSFMSSEKELYVHDGYVCADPRYRVNIRTITESPWANQFVYNMFLRIPKDELGGFEEDWLIVDAPNFRADAATDGTRQENFAILNFTKKIALVGGTGYTGEMKKGIFSALNFLLPQQNVLPMHCSANIGKEKGDTAVFFGLSGTGKTTLSTDPDRLLIGDDEHGWTEDNHIFNFEGGCYAKVIDLSEEHEPDIYHAINEYALLENVMFKSGTNEVNFEDSSITQNTRVSYPIFNIKNIVEPSIGKNPKHIFFLTADAFGVLPPISKLTPGQAAFHFISGYTAKVAGTEEGVDEPIPSFSACFGAPFMPLHPTVYAEMLSKKMKESGVQVWLINTGWSGGGYGKGSRIKLKYTRAMITDILEDKLNDVEYERGSVFGLYYPKSCPNVPTEMLDPLNTWSDEDAYYAKAKKLALSFHDNFKKFAAQASQEILDGAPTFKG